MSKDAGMVGGMSFADHQNGGAYHTKCTLLAQYLISIFILIYESFAFRSS